MAATMEGEEAKLLSQTLGESRPSAPAPGGRGARRFALGAAVLGTLAALLALAALAASSSSGARGGAGAAESLGRGGGLSVKAESSDAGAVEIKDDADSTEDKKDEHKALRKGKKHGKGKDKEPSWKTRRGSFLVIGDWGYDPQSHYLNLNNKTCVKAIAEKMLETMEMLGDVKFIINVGDSFYPSGVKSKDDPQWQAKWRDVFAPKLRSVPWYSVYGNHDYHADPCACSDDLSKCAQINDDPDNLDYFQMPNYTYYKPVPDFDMEIIGMDTNHFMLGWDHHKTGKDLSMADCQWTPCKDKCVPRMQSRMGASMDLFWQRYEKSRAKNLLVFSHYPTDYFLGGAPAFLDGLRNNSKHDIMFFGGHRHSTDTWSTCDISPNTNWLVGGGGGWSCDSDDQGFVVGEIQEDYSANTYAVLVDKEVCCLQPTTTTTPKTTVPAWR